MRGRRTEEMRGSGEIGESPNGIPNNLMPYIQQVVIGRRPYLSVFGDDYDTPDGTGVRDYIHIYDLAQGHLKALEFMFNKMSPGVEVFNLGSGRGYSVLEMVKAMVSVKRRHQDRKKRQVNQFLTRLHQDVKATLQFVMQIHRKQSECLGGKL